MMQQYELEAYLWGWSEAEWAARILQGDATDEDWSRVDQPLHVRKARIILGEQRFCELILLGSQAWADENLKGA